MPTYSYHCEGCDADFEKEQRITDAPVKKCPACGKLKARRMISGGNFILKGGGWYADAYGLKSGKGSSASSGGEASSSGAKSSADTAAASRDKPTKAGGDGAKADGAKADGAKADGAKADGAKADGTKSGTTS